MAGKRKRGEVWEYVFKRAGVLDKPLYLTFATEEEGDLYAKRLDALLDRGIVPTEHQVESTVRTIDDLVRMYLRDHSGVKDKDKAALGTVCNVLGATPLQAIDSSWVDAWISRLKREDHLAPATIRAKVGALARCADWGMRKKLLMLPDHPLRTLPDGYSQYTELDAALSGGKRVDIERDRRLESGEHERILKVLDGGVLPRKQRPRKLQHIPALRCLYLLALESAMRMREMYTLTLDQVDLEQRTVFLEKTKNGSKRQVPLSSVAMAALKDYLSKRELSEDALFPWWDGSFDKKKLADLSDYLSKLYGSIFETAECRDLTFHDLRHEATSRLFERTRLSEIEIMRITGHKSQRMLMRYTNLRGSSLAEKLW